MDDSPKDPRSLGDEENKEIEEMKWILIAMLGVPVAVADVYVAIPADTSKALYFPTVDTVVCFSVVEHSELVALETDRCWPVFLPSIVVEGIVLIMIGRTTEQLLESCASFNCELRAMPAPDSNEE